VVVKQVKVDSANNFAIKVQTGSTNWDTSGTYTVKAQYGTSIDKEFFQYQANKLTPKSTPDVPAPQDEVEPELELETKITICHYPPGNMDNPQTLTISESAWSAHDKHGDAFGGCTDKSKEKKFLASAEPVSTKVISTETQTSQDDDKLLEIIEENKKLREELELQGEEIDELNQEVDYLKNIIQSIQGFFGSIFG